MLRRLSRNPRRALLALILAPALVGLLASSALAYHYGSYTGDATHGNVGHVVHFTNYVSSPGDQYSNDGNSHYLGQQLRYEEHYSFAWHTEGTTVGSKSHFGASYHITKTSSPPSACHAAKFHDDYYYNSSQVNSAEAGEFTVCP